MKTKSKADPTAFSTFFDETTADDAKSRRLARQKEVVETVSQEDEEKEKARKERLAKIAKKEAEKTPPAPKKTPQNEAQGSMRQASEADKEALGYFKKNFTVELHGSKYKFFADSKHIFDQPTKPVDKEE